MIIFLTATNIVFADERTDDMLDRVIEEFSNENYQEALKIIDDVLILEPNNNVALMYKKTIEDVSKVDENEDGLINEEKDINEDNY